jgi:type IV secretion system protein TrbC
VVHSFNQSAYREVPMKKSSTALVNHQQKLLLAAFSVAMIYSGIAHGAGAGMPWETPLNNFLTSLTGPVAKIVGVAAVVITGLGIAFSEGGSGMRKIVMVAFGLTIAFSATTFFLPLFGYAGGAAF